MARVLLAENLRAVFYAPYYVAVACGHFAAEGVEVELSRSPRPEDTLARLLAGEVDIGWGGPLRVLTWLDRHPEAGLVCFAEVVGRDPFFLVGRAPREPFDLADLQAMRVGIVSEVPTPWICLQQDLRDRGVDPARVPVVAGRSMAENEAALRAGEIDAFQAFQPFAERAIRDGAGRLLHAAAERGPTAYTCFYTRRDRIAANREAFAAMARAMRRAVGWLYEQDGAAVAAAIQAYFAEVPPPLLAAAIDRYRALRLYNPTGVMPRAGFERLRVSMIAAGTIARGAAYEDCVEATLGG